MTLILALIRRDLTLSMRQGGGVGASASEESGGSAVTVRNEQSDDVGISMSPTP